VDRKANIFDRVLATLMIMVLVFSQGNLAVVFADEIRDEIAAEEAIAETVSEQPVEEVALVEEIVAVDEPEAVHDESEAVSTEEVLPEETTTAEQLSAEEVEVESTEEESQAETPVEESLNEEASDEKEISDSSEEDKDLSVGTESEEELSEETDSEENSEEELSEETEGDEDSEEDLSDEDELEGADEEEDDEAEVSYPAQHFEKGSSVGITVIVDAPDGAFPEGTEMQVAPVYNNDVLNQAAEAVGTEAQKVKAVDITFFNADGQEIEPLLAINVKLITSLIAEAEGAEVVHIDDAGVASVLDGTSVSGNAAEFSSDSFSIYAIVTTGDYARLKVIFKNGDSEIASMIVKKADINATDINDQPLFDQIIYDPGVGSLGGNEVFRGWTLDKDYTINDVESGMTIDGVRNAVKAKLNTGVSDGESVTYYAMIFNVINITYKDEDGVVIRNDGVLTKGDPITYTVDEGYTPKTSDQEFQGWYFSTSGTITDADGNEIAAGSVIEQDSTIIISADIVLTVKAPTGAWLIFKENGQGASYTSPQFLEGSKPEEPADPTRFGYEFGGWYTDAACTDGTEFDFDAILSETTIVYAKWIENKTAGYTIIIWKQNVNDNKNAADSAKKYDFAESFSMTGNVGSTINTVTANGTGNNRYASVNGTPKRYEGFHLNRYDQNVTINVNGTAVVNVYYDRNLITLTFQYRANRKWETQATMTGL